ncbi:glycerophosphodiester phosphodiesterase family protein [Dyadobacter sp. CY312]|uniref:glycerophosphodiester phosphodiesterase family protein n=1 Tax=Dyadobacter sp. CY312 TaxID=2907303 RepID=UPI001F3E7A2A|nr:glycerophosphodiester phosphodiesterase family protein [Dyadobacter sp. CY312]MCE7043057.1 alpha/beta hydrolase fold domain-containing protein [Dyadobacter sp. CY312]
MTNFFHKTYRLFCLLMCLAVHAVGQSQIALPESKNKLVVIAHRGNHVDVPENTIASFKEAIKAGADYVEVDLRSSKDGHLVVVHDATVDRTTNGKGKVADMSLVELKALKVLNGSKKPHKIPEFSEVLKVCKGKINIYLDFKEADVAETFRQIREAGMERQVVVYINKIPQYKQWRSIAPEVPLMTSLFGEVKNKEQLGMFLGQVKIEVLDNIADPEMVRVARENGVAVWLDVQSASEGPDSWNEALQKGVQGLQTDKPAELVKYLKKNGWRDGMPVSASAEVVKKKPSYIELKDVKYGDAPGNENLLDAFVPRNHTDSTKLIVYMHGGSWSRGDKSEFPKVLIDELVENRGYAVVSINYRLVKDGKDLFPAQIQDVKKALQFLADKSKKHQYNGSQFALMGGSAGAHLAMLYAYGHDPEKKVKAVIDLWGPTDLTDKMVRADGSDADNTVIRFLGEKDPQAQIAKDASPSYHLTKETGVPTILFHGGEDPLVHVSQAENLYKKLISLDIPAQYELYPNDKHGVSAASMVDVMSKLLVWLEKTYPAK